MLRNLRQLCNVGSIAADGGAASDTRWIRIACAHDCCRSGFSAGEAYCEVAAELWRDTDADSLRAGGGRHASTSGSVLAEDSEAAPTDSTLRPAAVDLLRQAEQAAEGE